MINNLIGLDIGGTNFKAGRVKDNSIVKTSTQEVHSKITENEAFSALYKVIDDVITEDVKGIGVGIPSVVDPVKGIFYDVVNIPVWKEVHLKEILEKRYHIPVFINNDANCFALGEKTFGKGRAYENMIGLSIGTGLGMGIIIHHKLYNGVLCGAGEIGMVNYKDSNIEQYASSFFFAKNYHKSAKEVSELAQKGDKEALQASNEFGVHLGEAIKNILYMYAPEAIILGGSISKAYPFYKKALETSLSTFIFQKQIENLKIEISEHQGLAILGAAALCLQE